MIFSKMSLLAFAVAHGVNANLGASNVNCTDTANHDDAVCICSLPKNRHMEICSEELIEELIGDDEINHLIINGEEVDPNVYPWFARATLKNGWAGCGGSLVSSEYVLTAAHCVEGRINKLERKGGYQIGALCAPYGPTSSSNCEQNVESFGISEIIPHPEYSSFTLENDFALVRLDGSSTIAPVDMDPGDISLGYENLPLKQNLWPAGFGTDESGSVTDKLMHVNVNYVKQSTCNSNYGGDITDAMMCAADTNQDSCQGDSGGPLYDEDNGVLVGVVSWGIGCALANYPGVYARISHQISWIQETICAEHSAPLPSFCGPTGPTVSPVPAPEPFVYISAFEAVQRGRNDKINTKLKFAVKNGDNEHAVGSEVKVEITYVPLTDPIVEEKTCEANRKGKCIVKLDKYDTQDYSEVVVRVLDIDSSLGAYNPEENKEFDGCAVFSSQCETYPLQADLV